jgi:membrane protein required for colicin V production
MGMIDIVLLVVIAVSTLLGVLRGFITTVVGTLSWLLAGWASIQYGSVATAWLSKGQSPSGSEYLAGYVLAFAAVLIAVTVLGKLLRAGVHAVFLGGLDRLLGLALGLLRGVLLALLVVLVMSFTPLTSAPAWRQSVMLPLLLPAVAWARAQLPDWSVAQADLGWQPLAGDNAGSGLGAVVSAVTQQAVERTLELRSKNAAVDGGDSSNAALPRNIEPTAAEAATEPTARDGAQHGQNRPLSQ